MFQILPGHGAGVNTDQRTFLICEKHSEAHFRRGIVIAKTAWPVSTEKAWRIELSCLCAKSRNLIGIAASNGNGRAKCDAQNFGTNPEAVQMQCG
jgi:ribosomal protein L24E